MYQEQGGKLSVLGYAYRTLTPPEKNYHMHAGKLEFLALKWVVTEKFRYYASINVKPEEGGTPGICGVFDLYCLPNP